MRKLKALLLRILPAISFLLAASRQLSADTPVSGLILTDTTWDVAGSPYIVTGEVSVSNTPPPVLTIQAGVTVRFNTSTRLTIASGQLQAIGTATDPIVFTANSPSPGPGFWGGIRFVDPAATSSRLAYATVQYGGTPGFYGGIHIADCSITIENSTLENHVHAGISTAGIGDSTVTGSTVRANPWGFRLANVGSISLTNTTISNNTQGGLHLSTPATVSLQTVAISNNSGFAASVAARVTLGSISGLTLTGNGTDAIEIRGGLTEGSIQANTTWRSLGPWPYVVTGDVDVIQNFGPVPVLTVEPGVILKFNSQRRLRVNSTAQLQAVGTPANSITFTANASTTPGFWSGIEIYSGPTITSRIAYATVSYAGGLPNNYGGIFIYRSSPTIENATVQNNANTGILVQGESGGVATPTITASTLTANPVGLFASYGSSPSLQNVTLSNNIGFAAAVDATVTLGTVTGLAVFGNGTNAFEIRPVGLLWLNTTWRNLGMPGIPYAITADVTVGNRNNLPTLTIEPGVTVKFNSGRRLIIGGPFDSGRLYAVGTGSQPIVFTGATAAPGAWPGIVISDTAQPTSRLAYAEISYGGGLSAGGLHIVSVSPTIDHVTFASNSYAGVSVSGALPRIENCNFLNNTAGIFNQTPTSAVGAALNWWNSPTGPSGAGPGSGQSVSAGVEFDPWLTTATSLPQYISSAILTNRKFNPTSTDLANWSLASSQVGNWTLTISNSSDVVLRTMTASGATATFEWDGKNGAGEEQPDAKYNYLIQTTTSGGDSAAPARSSTFIDRTLQIVIASPTAGQIISNVYQTGPDVTVTGTVLIAGLTRWTLDYGVGASPSSWTQINSGTLPVSSGTLGTWATLGLDNGTYTLRLQVSDNEGSRIDRLRAVTVANFKASQNVLQLSAPADNTVTYSSIIPFNLTETLFIKNAAGQTVRTVANAVARAPGTYSDVWNGRNDAGGLLPDGPYFYLANVTDGTNSLTWDLTGQNLDDYFDFRYPNLQVFDPFNNTPWTLTYNFNQPGRVTIAFSPGPMASNCNPPQFCILTAKYEESGPHTIRWAGVDNTGAFRGDAKLIAIVTERKAFSKNAVVVYGTSPTIANVSVTPPVYGPANGTQTIEFDLTTHQSQNADIQISILNQASVSVLRSITLTGQSPGHVTTGWDGRADNGMWVAPGFYTVTVTATDGLGNQVKGQILTNIQY